MPRKTAKDLYVQIRNAEKMLPKVEIAVLQLQILQNALEVLDETEIEIEEESDEAISAVTKFNRDYHYVCFSFYKALDELEKIGCIVRDLDDGLVDIRVEVSGKRLNLSWKLGEKSIEYWHDPVADPTVRNKIISLPELDKVLQKKMQVKRK